MKVEKDDPASGSWHLDRRIPIALIITLSIAFVGQTFAFGWWGSSIVTRLEQVERRQDQTAPQADRLTRVEVRIESIQEGINRIERLVQRPAPN